MVQYIGGSSVHWGNIMSISGVLNTSEGTMSAWGGGYHDASGGYHEYIEGCSVHQGIS